MTEQEQMDSLGLATSTLLRCERMVSKFAPGTSQHTLLKNRIGALKISQTLLGGCTVAEYTDEALAAALEPLASIIRKCEKAQSKYQPGSGQYNCYSGTIRAMESLQTLIENELHRRPI